MLLAMQQEVENNKHQIESSKLFFRSDSLLKKPAHFSEDSTFSTIWLRGPVSTGTSVHDELISVNTHLLPHFPVIANYILRFAKKKNSIPGRINIFFVSSEAIFKPHVDIGSYYAAHRRYHIVLKTDESIMSVGSKHLSFYEGDVFYINNKDMHTGQITNVAKGRIHVIFDLLPSRSHELILIFIEWMYLATKYKVEHQRENFFVRIRTFASISKAWRFSKKEKKSLFAQ